MADESPSGEDTGSPSSNETKKKSSRWSLAAERALSMSQSTEEESILDETATVDTADARRKSFKQGGDLNRTMKRQRSSQKLLEDIHHSNFTH